jgi:4-carboxymuconolactone decarboxylase
VLNSPGVSSRMTRCKHTAMRMSTSWALPPRIQAHTDLLARVDPALLALQEKKSGSIACTPQCFDVKTTQLMLFGMLLMNLQDAAKLHALAAYRAGATFQELTAVVNLAYLFRGLSAANYGSEILQSIAKDHQGSV